MAYIQVQRTVIFVVNINEQKNEGAAHRNMMKGILQHLFKKRTFRIKNYNTISCKIKFKAFLSRSYLHRCKGEYQCHLDGIKDSVEIRSIVILKIKLQ